MNTDDKLSHIAQLLSNSNLSGDNEQLLNEVKESINKIKIQKDAPAETEDVSKLKQTMIEIRRKNIELRRHAKEINEQFLSKIKNPTQEQLNSMEVSPLTYQILVF